MKLCTLAFASTVFAHTLGSSAAHAGGLITLEPGQDFLNGAAGVRGFEFTPFSGFAVYALGIADAPSGDVPAIGDGLENPRSVGLWDATGDLLASVIVPQGTSAPLLDGFRYESLPVPITLAADQIYVLGALYNFEADDHLYPDNGSSILASLGPGRTTPPPNTTELSFPSIASASRTYGPNLSTTPVPEPSTLILGCVGFLVTLLTRKRKPNVA